MDLPTLHWYEIVARLGVAALLGALVGLERGSSGHEAGLRTHVLVSVGSALFAVSSVGAFDEFLDLRSDTNVNIDVTRMAAYVAPGIGFIGAGVIVKNTRLGGHPMVMGLTTAASLWTVAAVGVASGLGFWLGAVVAAGVALLALVVARPLSDWLESRSTTQHELHLELTVGGDGVLGDVLAELARHGEVTSVDVRAAGGERIVGVDLRTERHRRGEGRDGAVNLLVDALANAPDVTAFRVAAAPG